MIGPLLYLFDDARARNWQPFALTRPIGEVLFGMHTFRSRAERRFRLPCAGHITATHLLGFGEPGAAPVIDPDHIMTDRPRVLLSSRALLDWAPPPVWPDNAARILVNDECVGFFVPAGAPTDVASLLDPNRTTAPPHEIALAGRVLQRPWDLVKNNAAQIAVDFEAELDEANDPGLADRISVDRIAYRAGMLRVGRRVTIEPNVVLDFANGPIHLDDGVTVRAFTRLAGPACIGAGSMLLGGTCEAVNIGPVCRVRGEVEETVIMGYSNKAHDGFLGHAILGRWVNLGAMTTNSDLKNNYGTNRMWTPDGDVDTGLIKLGCLLGDHVKTGIGTLLNTGTVIGAGSNLFGTAMPPKYVPPFSWGSGPELMPYDIEKFLHVAQTVMQRRNVPLSDGMRRVLHEAWHIGRTQV
jgi:UDP-N-acetylglucosamine diphosphorylase/glucosamine-1-phosphate N-acetyltransferase